jgi:hypothetical protein
MKRAPATFRLILLTILATLALPVAAAEADCPATGRVSLGGEERESDRIRVWFDVTVETEPACALVGYDLIVIEMLPNKQWKSVRRSGRIRTEDGAGGQRVFHEMSADLTLIGQDVQVVSCAPCETAASD